MCFIVFFPLGIFESIRGDRGLGGVCVCVYLSARCPTLHSLPPAGARYLMLGANFNWC